MKINKGLLAAVLGAALLIVGALALLPNKAIARTDSLTDVKEYEAFATVLDKKDVVVWSENDHGTNLREITFMGYNGTMFRIFLPPQGRFILDAWRINPKSRGYSDNLGVNKNYLIHYRSTPAWSGHPKQLYEITYYEELRR